jgi:ABC-type Fe3+/spermidine/putrescine transport system ATPase subunit
MIVVLVAGRVVQSGAPADVAARPRTATVARLVGAANVLSGRVVGREDGAAVVRAEPFLLRLANPAGGERVQVCVRPEGLRVGPAGSGGVEARVLRVLPRRVGATVLLAAGGTQLEAWTAARPPEPGTVVDVSIPDGAAHALEPEEPRTATMQSTPAR